MRTSGVYVWNAKINLMTKITAGRNISSENWNYRDLQVSRRIILGILVDNKEILISVQKEM